MQQDIVISQVVIKTHGPPDILKATGEEEGEDEIQIEAWENTYESHFDCEEYNKIE